MSSPLAYVVEGLFFIINLYQSVEIYRNLYKSVDKKKTTSKLIEIVSCTPAGARTLDTLIKSQVLYQLSYKRIICWCFRLQYACRGSNPGHPD